MCILLANYICKCIHAESIEFYRKTLRIFRVFNINAFTFFAQFVHTSVLILATPSASHLSHLREDPRELVAGAGLVWVETWLRLAAHPHMGQTCIHHLICQVLIPT